MWRKTQRIVEAQRPTEQRFPAPHRQLGQVMTGKMQKIKKIQMHHDAAGTGLVPVGDWHPVLQT